MSNNNSSDISLMSAQRDILHRALLIGISDGYDLGSMVDNYCTSEYGIKASDNIIKYRLECAYTVMLHGFGKLIPSTKEYDVVMSDWIADILLEFMWSGVKTYELVKYVMPSKILSKFSPLHETTIRSGCRKIAEHYNFNYEHSSGWNW